MAAHPGQDRPVVKVPVAIMSFNRPGYLNQVIQSIKRQERVDLGEYDFHLFQDGAVNKYSNETYANFGDLEYCTRIFLEAFPNGVVHNWEHNIGVCENFLRAESEFFEKQGAPVAYFFEDDLKLEPDYFFYMEKVRKLSEASGSVGYFAAYGALRHSTEHVIRNQQRLNRMDHLWGFGLFKSHWFAMQPQMQIYYDLVLGKDYRKRNTEHIFSELKRNGILVRASSQDDVKKAVTYNLQKVALNTWLPHALYIGETGLHMNPETFRSLGFDKTVIVKPDNEELKFPSKDTIAEWIQRELDGRVKDTAEIAI
ncbi:hypothetical protein [Pseudoroseomonas cervicalis]|uniref:hypothetical protein n=1 Tax=Teichococcus cervicalis TaxID=204525 RepID=UPI0022F1C737|nr:hypothetical protein [Pseudoroseomonas cervicalis]WBV42548.1 hypothetical protein PFY06_15085 [Pseudoroseomonas cervicalis]